MIPRCHRLDFLRGERAKRRRELAASLGRRDEQYDQLGTRTTVTLVNGVRVETRGQPCIGARAASNPRRY